MSGTPSMSSIVSEERGVRTDADLGDVTSVRGRRDLEVRRRMILVIPDEHRAACPPGRRRYRDPLDVGARPRIDGSVTAVMPVVAKRVGVMDA